MEGKTSVPTTAELTPQEAQVTEALEIAYGAMARQAAARLAEAVGLDESARAQFIGGVATLLDSLHFDDRRDAATLADRYTAKLTGKSSIETPPDLTLVASLSSEPEPEAAPQRTGRQRKSTRRSGTKAKRSASVSSSGHESLGAGEIRTDSDEIVFGKTQHSWLSRVLEESSIAQLEKLSAPQREEFVRRLTETYRALPITPLGPDKKKKGAQQIEWFLSGLDISEVAARSDQSYGAVAARLNSLSKSIAKRKTKEEIAALIPDPESASDMPKD